MTEQLSVEVNVKKVSNISEKMSKIRKFFLKIDFLTISKNDGQNPKPYSNHFVKNGAQNHST